MKTEILIMDTKDEMRLLAVPPQNEYCEIDALLTWERLSNVPPIKRDTPKRLRSPLRSTIKMPAPTSSVIGRLLATFSRRA